MGVSNERIEKIMKNRSDVILGDYNYQEGGSIRLNMGHNMQYDFASSTQIHEMNHAHLDNVTTLGTLLKLLNMERICTPESDTRHSSRIHKYENIIRNRTSDVQEVYSNCIEILLIKKLGGEDAARRIYDSKPEHYQNYCNCLDDIMADKVMSDDEKHRVINALCFYAMGIDIAVDEFIKIIKNDELVYFLDNLNNPNERLKKGIEMYKEGNLNQIVNAVSNQYQFDLIIKLIESKQLKYINDLGSDVQQLINNFNEGNLDPKVVDYWIGKYQENIEEHIKAFDLSHLKVYRNDDAFQKINLGMLILKQCENIVEDEDYYIIGHENIDNEPYYVSKEVNKLELEEMINKVECICLSNHEYDTKVQKPVFVNSYNKPKFIIFDSYQDCYEWVCQEVVDKDYYVGNLYDKSVNNFFTVLFFVNRKKSDTIYVFPTTKILAERIISNLLSEDEIIYSCDDAFLKIFSCFKDNIKRMEILQWILAFFTNSKGNYDVKNDSASKLSFDFIRTILNTSFDLTRKDNYKLMFALPTKFTKGNPFYAVMIFEGKNNSGKICTPKDKYIVFFFNEAIANCWKNKHQELNYINYSLEVVGVDNVYWDSIKEMIIRNNVNILVCINVINNSSEDNYQVFNANMVDVIIRNFKG